MAIKVEQIRSYETGSSGEPVRIADLGPGDFESRPPSMEEAAAALAEAVADEPSAPDAASRPPGRAGATPPSKGASPERPSGAPGSGRPPTDEELAAGIATAGEWAHLYPIDKPPSPPGANADEAAWLAACGIES